jgi:hypothetical protein
VTHAWALTGSGRERERERRRAGHVGRPGGKRSVPIPKEQENFQFIQINFKLVQFVLIKRWTYLALKIRNKIWMEGV